MELWKRTFSRRAGREAQEGRQKTPVERTEYQKRPSASGLRARTAAQRSASVEQGRGLAGMGGLGDTGSVSIEPSLRVGRPGGAPNLAFESKVIGRIVLRSRCGGLRGEVVLASVTVAGDT